MADARVDMLHHTSTESNRPQKTTPNADRVVDQVADREEEDVNIGEDQ